MEDNKELKELNKKKRFWIVLCVFLAIVFLFFLISIILIMKKDRGFELNPFNKKVVETNDITATHLTGRYLDGLMVEVGEENNYPVAVIIDNLKEARPQSGLSKASVVYEAEAEGGITRYLAIYAGGKDVGEIGPIRSARSYFVDWAEEYSAAYIHCGGSPDALVKISKDNVFDFNEFYNGDYFWRRPDKSSPHNIYIRGESIVSFLNKNNADKGKYLPWSFKEEAETQQRPEGGEILIDFPSDDYKVKWQYDRANNQYNRFLGGREHYDENGKIITAKNIIIQYVQAQEVDDKLRLKLDTTGEGETVVCLDGKCEVGKWNKRISGSRTRFFDNNGNEFKFNAGLIWIEVVRKEYEIKY